MPWAERNGIETADRAALVEHEEVRALFEREIEAANKHPEAAKYEQIHALHLLTAEFSIETGELTPTQKVKRRVIRDKYGNQIESMYAGAERG